MAKIFSVPTGKGYRIAVEGCLRARDLKHLERACHSALECRVVPLELDLNKVIAMDRTAAAYVDRLRARGASVRGAPGLDARRAE